MVKVYYWTSAFPFEQCLYIPKWFAFSFVIDPSMPEQGTETLISLACKHELSKSIHELCRYRMALKYILISRNVFSYILLLTCLVSDLRRYWMAHTKVEILNRSWNGPAMQNAEKMISKFWFFAYENYLIRKITFIE